MRRSTRRAIGMTSHGNSTEKPPPSVMSARSGHGRNRGTRRERRSKFFAATRGSSGRTTRSTNPSVKSSPTGSFSTPASSFAPGSEGRSSAAASQRRTRATVSSRVGRSGGTAMVHQGRRHAWAPPVAPRFRRPAARVSGAARRNRGRAVGSGRSGRGGRLELGGAHALHRGRPALELVDERLQAREVLLARREDAEVLEVVEERKRELGADVGDLQLAEGAAQLVGGAH